jgi:hypothetical protein
MPGFFNALSKFAPSMLTAKKEVVFYSCFPMKIEDFFAFSTALPKNTFQNIRLREVCKTLPLNSFKQRNFEIQNLDFWLTREGAKPDVKNEKRCGCRGVWFSIPF